MQSDNEPRLLGTHEVMADRISTPASTDKRRQMSANPVYKFLCHEVDSRLRADFLTGGEWRHWWTPQYIKASRFNSSSVIVSAAFFTFI